ncbi:hypothetical protein MKW98_017327 [Papaver atlanticum]|uniref:Transcription factor CBF/NF-Y/archaeal histone domain-containing protein n=1 Tax=Papaver atlanticum TaxID=357466 RepID=A0AAD4XKI0_9MAGN|nr:hypothetical protein MKW98_017327 [Papaver atlanticum]
MDLLWLLGDMFGRFNENECEDSDGEETRAFYEEENKAIHDVKVLGFNPMNKDVILLSYDYGVWAYNTGTSKYEELVEPKFVAKMHKNYNFRDRKAPSVHNPFVIKAMATILPPPSWKNTSDQPGHGQPPDVGMVASAGQMPYGETQYPSNQIIGGPSVGSIQSPGQTVGFSTSQAQLVQHQLAYQLIHQQQQPQLENQLQTDFKNNSLPLARIKKIMKANEDVKRIASEVPVILAMACEMFISDLTLCSWNHTEERKRKTLQKNDIDAAITESDIFDFLADNQSRACASWRSF